MHVTPLAMPLRKTNHAPAREVAYTTSTGDQPRTAPSNTSFDAYFEDNYDPFCFVCSRCTDHVGEHDALVEAGMASYDDKGMVHKTATYERKQALAIAEAEYQRLYGHLHSEDVA